MLVVCESVFVFASVGALRVSVGVGSRHLSPGRLVWGPRNPRPKSRTSTRVDVWGFRVNPAPQTLNLNPTEASTPDPWPQTSPFWGSYPSSS
jgi:hypothetical protein